MVIMDNNQISKFLDDSFYLSKLELDKSIDSYSLFQDFYYLFESEREKLPFNLNLIETAVSKNTQKRLFENTHSDYISEFLKYTEDNKFPILSSFLSYFKIEKDVISPVIYREKYNIDIAVFDKEYAIIFENKINQAPDQKEQLQRYIRDVVNIGYSEKDIFIFYLTGSEYYTPTEVSISPQKMRKLEKDNRLFCVTFKHEISGWLDSIDLTGNIYFDSAIFQYKEYLYRIYGKNKIQQAMDTRIKEYLLDRIRLQRDSLNIKEQIENIDSIMSNMETLISYLREIRADKINRAFEITLDSLVGIPVVHDENNMRISVELMYNKRKLTLNIHFPQSDADGDLEDLYLSFEHDYRTRDKETYNFIINNFSSNGWRLDIDDDQCYFRWKYVTFESAAEEFRKAYFTFMDLIK